MLPVHTLERVFKRIGKRLNGPRRFEPTLNLEFILELSRVNFLEPTICVMDQHNFPSVQKPLRQNERSLHVIGDNATGVADHVSVTVSQSEHLENIHTGVHARNDR
jgi:hypothetical protein